MLVVEDSVFQSRNILRILEEHPLLEVIGVARNGKEAIKEVVLKSPDLITLDLEMPLMDGFTFLRWLMFNRPTRTIIISSWGSRGNVFRALEMGALDFIVKPDRGEKDQLSRWEEELVRKLETAMKVDISKVESRLARPSRTEPVVAPVTPRSWSPDLRVVVIASSTGGPPAIQNILQSMPSDYPAAILVNQHMPAGFTALFSRRLDQMVALRVKEGEDKETLKAGVYIAPGSSHMAMEKRRGKVSLRIVPAAPTDRYVPSADRLFQSAAEVFGSGCIGIVLTGMGEDGVNGLSSLKGAGGKIIAEDESSCVIYGMPKAAVERGLADRVLPLKDISGVLMRMSRA
jgi:two-component system chemotaxis response regulator CheB